MNTGTVTSRLVFQSAEVSYEPPTNVDGGERAPDPEPMAPSRPLLPRPRTTERGRQMSFAQTRAPARSRMSDAIATYWPELRDDATALARSLPALPETELIAMNLQRAEGGWTAANGEVSSLDAARGARGLAELALVLASEDRPVARYLAERAVVQWREIRRLLRSEQGYPWHWARISSQGRVVEARLGETGSHDRHVDTAGLYPASDSLYLAWIAERFPELGLDPRGYLQSLEADVQRLIDQFYLPPAGTLAHHRNARTGSKAEPEHPGGIVGTHGTVIGSSALWIPALDTLVDQKLSLPLTGGHAEVVSFPEWVKRQLDLVAERFVFLNGCMWETYQAYSDGRLEPIRISDQTLPVTPPLTLKDGTLVTHSQAAVGGHTVMAGQCLAEGALELYRVGHIDRQVRDRYLSRALKILQDAIDHHVIEWNAGRVQNTNLLEIPSSPRELTHPERDDAESAWQNRELLQTLLILDEANRLTSLVGPGNARGPELALNVLERVRRESVPADYCGGFADPWRYHIPRALTYLQRWRARC